MRHVLLAAIYAACLGAFFGSLLREDWRSAFKLFATLFLVMVLGVVVFGWLMALLAP